MKQILKVLLLPMLILVLFSGCTQSQPSLKMLYLDYLARQDIKKEKFEEALTQYYALLEIEVSKPETHSNIGVLLNSVQKPEDSLKSLQYALTLAEAQKNPDLIFKVRYNLGVYYGALKKIPEALEHYQAALDILPTSNEVKTNIELLIQQQKQEQKQQNKQGDKKQDPKDGQGENKDKKQGEDPKDEKKDKDKDGDQDKKNDQKKESSPKYQPRPYQGDQLSEGDVKKILGELKNQEQKIRANFEKKEKGKSKNNEKDW